MKYLICLLAITTLLGAGCNNPTKRTDAAQVPVETDTESIPTTQEITFVVVGIEDDGSLTAVDQATGDIRGVSFDDATIMLPPTAGQSFKDGNLGQTIEVIGAMNDAGSFYATQMTVSELREIGIALPLKNQNALNPVRVLAAARAFENVISWRIKDVDGNTITSGTSRVAAPDAGKFGLSNISISLPTDSKGTFTLEIYTTSAKDGSDSNLVRRDFLID